MQSTDELSFIYSSFSKRQRDLLISLLTEEKENIERFKDQNQWVAERIEIIESILSAINY